jgi:hypothetical protein
MHFLDAWSRLTPLELARTSAVPVFVLISIAFAGRRAALFTSIGLAACSLFPLGAVVWGVRLAWSLLWLAYARALARSADDPPADPSTRRGGLESGAVGLLLGIALLLLLVAAVARQDLPDAESRDASYGLLLIGLGLIHLMLRRHVLRAAVAFGVMGLGLDQLTRAASAQQLPGDHVPALVVPAATALAMALVTRIARSRSENGSAWVSGAHDLHD